MVNKQEAGMSLIVKTVTRLTVGLILIYGIYIVLRGHIGPGGGFAGGVIIALSFIHLMLAYGKEAALKKLNEKRGLLLCGFGAVVLLFSVLFISSGKDRVAGGKGGFGLFSGGIPLIDIAAACMVGAGLFVIFLALILLTSSREEK